MFMGALFIIVKTCKQPKCPLTDEWIKMWCGIYMSMMKYYSAMEKNEILPLTATWMDLVGIMLSEISQIKDV